MLKTYFCKLVPGFSPDQNQTSLGQFSGLYRSIIIEKKWNFCIWLAVTGSFRQGGCQNTLKSLYILKENSELHKY